MKHVKLRMVQDAAVPEGYGVLFGRGGWYAAKGAPGVSPSWVGHPRKEPAAAVADAWIHATGSTPFGANPEEVAP